MLQAIFITIGGQDSGRCVGIIVWHDAGGIGRRGRQCFAGSEGIRYLHWKSKMFHMGDKITLMDDIVALIMDEAVCLLQNPESASLHDVNVVRGLLVT